MKKAVLNQLAASALLAAGLTLCFLAPPADAQSYTLLHPFKTAQPTPRGLVQASDGNFYGTTNQGGASGFGSVFKVTPAGTLTTLYSFSGSDGQAPFGTLVQGIDGNFYGTTTQGGAGNYGTVFKITPAGTLTTLHSFSFSFSGSDGNHPYAGVVQGADGNFYGTTAAGGTGNYGTVFKITPAGTLTMLHSFARSDGQGPHAGLVQGTDGNFYGTTYYGGASNVGAVFKITPAGTLTTLYSFAGTDGSHPQASLVQGTDGNFYGTTYQGGTGGYGTVFRITPVGVLTTLYSFTFSEGTSDGLVQGTDGNFYGTTEGMISFGETFGTVFKITPAGAMTTLYTFTSSNGGHLYAGLVQGTDGNFYGTTSSGGGRASPIGTIFKITPAGALTTLYSFAGGEGEYPYAGLVQGTDGNLYGTTDQGGTNGVGTVFKITPTGTLTTLHSFNGSDGARPYLATLVQGIDGNFYGTTSSGGTSNIGTVFKITPAGDLTMLHSFASSTDGVFPEAGVVQGIDGNFYGTTLFSGNSGGNGTVFKVTPAGTLTTLHSFANSEGKYPYSGLVQGTDGNFYGTTAQGGASDIGAVFKITPAGVLTTLHSFANSDGGYPYAGLAEGPDGNFYGTTYQGGTADHGTVFKITPAGGLTTLHSFTGIDGVYPYAGLARGTDGNFYGTTHEGVFKITPAGVLTTLYWFSGSDGSQPEATLMLGTDGNFYGTTSNGGPLGGGVVFRLTPGPGPSPTVTGVSPASGSVSGGSVVTVSGTDFQPGATVSFGGVAATGITYVSATTINVLTPIHAAGAVTVAVTNPDLQSGSLASAYTYTCSWTPAALNSGAYCTGGTISLSTPTVSGATYSWTGPSGFASTLQNPTIANATVANAGTYSVTVTVAGCTSAAGGTAVVVNAVPATPFIAAPSFVGAGSQNWAASVASHAGSSYAWSITNGTITSGQGSNQIAFTAGTAGIPLTLSVTETNSSGCATASAAATVTVTSAGSAARFYALPPCRVLDTRNATGPLGAPALQSAATRTFDPVSSSCGIPSGAVAISANLTVTNVGALGELVMFPSDVLQPNTSALSFRAGRTRANNSIVSLANPSATFSVFNNSPATVDFILDVNGYFQ